MENTENSYQSANLRPHSQTSAPPILERLAEEAGITINGDTPWDIQIYDDEVYRRILTQGSLGFGESYVDGQWDTECLDQLFHHIMAADVEQKLSRWAKVRLLGEILRQRFFNMQSHKHAFQVGEEHYDTGNDVFEAMLDPSMSYTCGYWKNATSLEQAQVDKMRMICEKLQLQPGERLLDIGCGWGSLAKFAAENYGVEVVGVTVSKEQQHFAQQRCAGLPVTIELKDYRDVRGEFDKIVSVGMFEHVGIKNYRTYFDSVNTLLKDDGLFLLHTIGIYKTSPNTDDWIDKYIFPNGKLPSAKEISTAIENRFLIEDWHNFGQDYDRTLMAWWDNFNTNWSQLKDKYGERFYRIWKYYLMSCAGFFRSRQGQLWQLVLSKRQRSNMYRSIR